MSFGFSAGDFLAAGKLVHDVIQSLQDVGGAKSDYQEIIRELYSLNKALRHLDGLQSDSSGQDRTFQSIKFAALSCRRPLEQFLAKSKKFDSTLDVRAKTQTTKSVFRKLQWGLGMKSEVTKLQGYLNLHVSTINILLSEHSLERLSLVQNRIDTETFQLREKLDAAEGVIGRIDQNVADQMALIQNTQTATRSMLNLICGDFRTSWRSLGQMIAQICVSMQQIYGVVLEIKASNTPIDIRHTWFQTPLLCEDALGIKFPIPSEWDYGMVASHIRYRFREGIGSRIFLEGHWDLFQTRDSKELIRESTRLLPGLEVTMALIVLPLLSINNSCPVLGCASTETVPTQGESRLCHTCGTTFGRLPELPNKDVYLMTSSTACDENSRGPGSPHRAEYVQRKNRPWYEQDGLKNVRWSRFVGSRPRDKDLAFKIAKHYDLKRRRQSAAARIDSAKTIHSLSTGTKRKQSDERNSTASYSSEAASDLADQRTSIHKKHRKHE